MTRFLLWLIGGVLLGGIIHIIVILTLPMLAEESTWSRIEAIATKNAMVILPAVEAGARNPLQLDPELVYGLCLVDLAEGPAFLSGTLPDAFWSLAVFNQSGAVAYSTTNRDGIGQTVDLGIFNAAQTRLLAQQQLDIGEGLLVVESTTDKLAVLVRLAPSHEAMRPRFAASLAAIRCGPRT